MFECIIEGIKERIAQFGHAPICNLNPSHGFQINGFYFPLCTRCSAIVFSALLALFVIVILKEKYKFKKWVNIVLFLLFIPCLLDGVLQYFFGIESTNFRRALTGFLLGISLVNTTFVLVEFAFDKLYKPKT